MCMKSHICAILDYFLSPESRFEKWMSLNIIFNVFNLPGISLAKKEGGWSLHRFRVSWYYLRYSALKAYLSKENIFKLQPSLKLFLEKHKYTKQGFSTW